jgi:purine-binding chemotaxis protein CheW
MTQEPEIKDAAQQHYDQEQNSTAQYLSFSLDNEEYGVDILRVQEIRSWEPVSMVPNVPFYEKGVVNLRGSIVPIIDLREKLQIKFREYTSLTVVVILQTNDGSKTRTMGVVVDSVSDVITVDKAKIQDAPDFGGKISSDYINGLVSVNEQMLILLDVDKLLKLEELEPSEN